MRRKASDRIKELHAILERDWNGTQRKYPDQAIFAMNDDRVINAIDKRLGNKGTIKDIRSFDYDFYTGLTPVCFEFTPPTGGIGLPSSDAILILMNGDCKVVAVIDPFDPSQPNQNVPMLPKEGEQPFALSRPSITDELVYYDQELYPVQVRSREFFKKLTSGGSQTIQRKNGDGGGGGDVIIIIATQCPYMTRTPQDYDTGYQNDECGSADDIIWET